MHALIAIYLTGMVIAVLIAAYLLPTFIAWARHAPETTAVAIVNITLGWTFIGWIAALILALRRPAAPAVQVFSQLNATQAQPGAPATDVTPRHHDHRPGPHPPGAGER